MSTISEVPRTRSLPAIIEALRVTESELSFQIKRLNEHVVSKTDEEAKFHDDLKNGYKQSAFFIRTLRRYQEGRLAGRQDISDQTAFDEAGRATPYSDDEEA